MELCIAYHRMNYIRNAVKLFLFISVSLVVELSFAQQLEVHKSEKFHYDLFCTAPFGTLFVNLSQYDLIYQSEIDKKLNYFETLLVEEVPSCSACRLITFLPVENTEKIYTAKIQIRMIQAPRRAPPAPYQITLSSVDENEKTSYVMKNAPCYFKSEEI